MKTITGELGIYEASYECDSGYELFGPSVTKCDAVRGWDKELPFCGKYSSFYLGIVYYDISREKKRAKVEICSSSKKKWQIFDHYKFTMGSRFMVTIIER